MLIDRGLCHLADDGSRAIGTDGALHTGVDAAHTLILRARLFCVAAGVRCESFSCLLMSSHGSSTGVLSFVRVRLRALCRLCARVSPFPLRASRPFLCARLAHPYEPRNGWALGSTQMTPGTRACEDRRCCLSLRCGRRVSGTCPRPRAVALLPSLATIFFVGALMGGLAAVGGWRQGPRVCVSGWTRSHDHARSGSVVATG